MGRIILKRNIDLSGSVSPTDGYVVAFDEGKLKKKASSGVVTQIEPSSSLRSKSSINVGVTGNILVPMLLPLSNGLSDMIPNQTTKSTYGSVPGVGLLYLTYTENYETSGLIGLTFSDLDHIVGSFNMSQMSELIDLSLPELNIVGGSFNLSAVGSLENLDVPKLSIVSEDFNVSINGGLNAYHLEYVYGSFYIYNSRRPSLNLKSLTIVKGIFNIVKVISVVILTFPSLSIVGGINLNGMVSLETVFFPVLRTSGDITMIKTSLTSVILPSLVSCGDVNISGGISTVQIGTLGTLKSIGDISIIDQALSVSSIEKIINILSSLNGENNTTEWIGTLNISGGTSAYLTDLSPKTIQNKKTIENRGGQVIINELPVSAYLSIFTVYTNGNGVGSSNSMENRRRSEYVLPGALVQVGQDGLHGYIASGVSDEFGIFKTQLLDGGTYSYNVSLEGYISLPDEVVVIDNESITNVVENLVEVTAATIVVPTNVYFSFWPELVISGNGIIPDQYEPLIGSSITVKLGGTVVSSGIVDGTGEFKTQLLSYDNYTYDLSLNGYTSIVDEPIIISEKTTRVEELTVYVNSRPIPV